MEKLNFSMEKFFLREKFQFEKKSTFPFNFSLEKYFSLGKVFFFWEKNFSPTKSVLKGSYLKGNVHPC